MKKTTIIICSVILENYVGPFKNEMLVVVVEIKG